MNAVRMNQERALYFLSRSHHCSRQTLSTAEIDLLRVSRPIDRALHRKLADAEREMDAHERGAAVDSVVAVDNDAIDSAAVTRSAMCAAVIDAHMGRDCDASGAFAGRVSSGQLCESDRTAFVDAYESQFKAVRS